MQSIAILSAILFALFAITNALECEPVLCRMMCPFGYDVDVQGCQICSCIESSSTESSVAADSTTAAPGTSTIRVFKRSAAFSTNSARLTTQAAGTSARHTSRASGISTRRVFTRSATSSTEPATTAQGTGAPASTAQSFALLRRSATGASTARSATTAAGRSTRRVFKRSATSSTESATSAQGSDSPASTTGSSVTTA